MRHSSSPHCRIHTRCDYCSSTAVVFWRTQLRVEYSVCRLMRVICHKHKLCLENFSCTPLSPAQTTEFYSRLTPPDNQRRNPVMALSPYQCLSQIIWWRDRFTDPGRNLLNCSRTHWGSPGHFQHVSYLGFKAWMITVMMTFKPLRLTLVSIQLLTDIKTDQ